MPKQFLFGEMLQMRPKHSMRKCWQNVTKSNLQTIGVTDEWYVVSQNRQKTVLDQLWNCYSTNRKNAQQLNWASASSNIPAHVVGLPEKGRPHVRSTIAFVPYHTRSPLVISSMGNHRTPLLFMSGRLSWPGSRCVCVCVWVGLYVRVCVCVAVMLSAVDLEELL